MHDPCNLERFVDAQDPVFERVIVELASGQKQSHWMWFVFPQIEDLGLSSVARLYSISSHTEAVAYLEHGILGSRLRQCTRLVLDTEGRSLRQIFGSPDDMKFRSSMTLFANAAPGGEEFVSALRARFGPS